MVIVAARRTPIGSFNGALATLQAHELASVVFKDLLGSSGVAAEEVEDVIMGQVLVGGQGQNPARQAALGAGLPHTSTAMGVAMVCGSGLRAVALAAQAIALGDSTVVLAGGMESMSMARHTVHMRPGVKFGEVGLQDSLLTDGLTDAMLGIHMGVTAENVAKQFGLSREEQDAFAAGSQEKAGAAAREGHFLAEVVPVSVAVPRKAAVVVAKDEFPRPDTTQDTLAKLRPAFVKDGSGTVTAGNSSGINDGAAAVLLMSREEAARRGLAPLCTIVCSAMAGVDPAVMGTGPVPAVTRALARAGWTAESVDLWELNEAFAAQALAVVRELGVDPARVNVCGGSIALGHPIGASGCRVLVTLVHAMRRLGAARGVASLCIGGGMGIAMCVQI